MVTRYQVTKLHINRNFWLVFSWILWTIHRNILAIAVCLYCLSQAIFSSIGIFLCFLCSSTFIEHSFFSIPLLTPPNELQSSKYIVLKFSNISVSLNKNATVLCKWLYNVTQSEFCIVRCHNSIVNLVLFDSGWNWKAEKDNFGKRLKYSQSREVLLHKVIFYTVLWENLKRNKKIIDLEISICYHGKVSTNLCLLHKRLKFF